MIGGAEAAAGVRTGMINTAVIRRQALKNMRNIRQETIERAIDLGFAGPGGEGGFWDRMTEIDINEMTGYAADWSSSSGQIVKGKKNYAPKNQWIDLDPGRDDFGSPGSRGGTTAPRYAKSAFRSRRDRRTVQRRINLGGGQAGQGSIGI